MKFALKYISLAALVFLVQCKSTRPLSSAAAHAARVTEEGLITCFEPGVAVKGQPVCCEASALLYDGTKIFFANDKDMPDARSSVFYWPFKKGFADTSGPASYLDGAVFKTAKKFEDFALSEDGKLVFLTTAFDRVQPNSKEWDGYNTLLYWQVGNESKPQVLSVNGTDSTSVSLREKISKALATPEFPAGMPYFKIEGLAATNGMLYFGIRETGKKFDDFKYQAKILRAGYRIENGRVVLDDAFSVFSDLNVSTLAPQIKEPVGLSSIEYDHFNKRFLIVTSHENATVLGAYLWSATIEDLGKNTMTLVNDAQGAALHLAHKAEDIIIVNRNRTILINDDDRMLTTVNGKTRAQNQAVYTIVEFAGK